MKKATSGQFRELIGRLLIKGNEQKIHLIDKQKIQEKINLLSSLKGDMFFMAFVDFINKSDSFNFLSQYFPKSKKMLVKKMSSFTLTEESINNFFREVIEREKRIKIIGLELGMSKPFFMRILEMFGGCELPPIRKERVFEISRIPILIEMVEIEKIIRKDIFSISEMLFILKESILEGEMDKREASLFINFSFGDKTFLMKAERRTLQLVFSLVSIEWDHLKKLPVLKPGDGIVYFSNNMSWKELKELNTVDKDGEHINIK